MAVAAVVALLGGAAHADTSRLSSLLAATPQGGWIQASTSSWSNAWPTGSTAVPEGAGSNVLAVAIAWSSFAWDSRRDSLLLWGGGHANYKGNEMYVWDAGTGAWSRGSLPSRLGANDFVVDNAAPQSAHTYDNNVYLPVNNMFLTFGGAAYNSGGNFRTDIGGVVERAGPWLWDPTKADGNKVGGTTGSGYDASTPGGNMWINRAGSIVGTQGPSYVQGATAYRTEIIGGKATDVVYVTSDSQASGLPGLYRYVASDVRNGGTDTMQQVGADFSTGVYQGSATIDTTHNLYVRTAFNNVAGDPDFAVWDLTKSDATAPRNNREIPIRLALADGTAFKMSPNYGIDYDEANGNMLLWDGATGGQVWEVEAGYAADGSLLSTWLVKALPRTTATAPAGSFVSGVLGKWQYISELGAYMALDNYDFTARDASVWLYKPYSTAPVPELPVPVMMLAGLGLLMGVRRRRVRSTAQPAL